MKRLAVIIVTYNGMQWLERCLASVASSSYEADTIVVDNCSTDRSADFVAEHYPAVKLVRNTQNEGFGRANNRAMRMAIDRGADYLYLLNQDAWITPEQLGRLVDIMERHPDYGIIGPVQLSADELHINENFGRWLNTKTAPNFIDDAYFGRLSELYEMKLFPADNWLVRSKTIEQVGGFSPVFFFYGEDSEMVARIYYHGWKMGVAPHCRAVHDIADRQSPPERELMMEYLLYVIDINDPRRNFTSRCIMAWWKMVIDMGRMPGPRRLKWHYAFKALGQIAPSRRNRRLTKRGHCYL